MRPLSVSCSSHHLQSSNCGHFFSTSQLKQIQLGPSEHTVHLAGFQVLPSKFIHDSFVFHYIFLLFLCYVLLPVLPLLSFFDLGIFFLSSQFHQISLLAFPLFSACVPILNFPFFRCNQLFLSSSVVSSYQLSQERSAPSILSFQYPTFFQNCTPLVMSLLFQHGSFPLCFLT